MKYIEVPSSTEGVIGFVGLGVMGAGMCRNLIRRAPNANFLVHDQRAEAVESMVGPTATSATIEEIADTAKIILLSLPNGDAVATVLSQMLPYLNAGTVIIDTSTSPVMMTRNFAAYVQEREAHWLDAPVARTREAAENGTLSIMVGGDEAIFSRVRSILDTMGTDVSYCGEVGAGQVVKILNNMVLFQTVNALSEALAIGRAAGVSGEVLFEALSKGSADSFALRNHGIKALLPGNFPLRAFSTAYARKDNNYALELAKTVGIDAVGAQLLEQIFDRSERAGLVDLYFPVFHQLHSKSQ